MIYMFLNLIKEYFDYFFQTQENGVKQLYLVGYNGKKVLTVDELNKPYNHMEIEFVYNNKTYIQVVSGFHRNHELPIILSAILNDKIDITNHINKYLINDLTYLQVKHIIPPKYLNTFESLEILDEGCNSLIYRNLESTMEFLEKPSTIFRERSNSCFH